MAKDKQFEIIKKAIDEESKKDSSFAAVKRLQEQQENQQKEITKIKQVLHIK